MAIFGIYSIVISSGVITIRVEQRSVRPFLVVHPMEACFINRDISLGFGHRLYLKLTNPDASKYAIGIPTFARKTTHCFLVNRPYIHRIKGKQKREVLNSWKKNMTESFKASSIT